MGMCWEIVFICHLPFDSWNFFVRLSSKIIIKNIFRLHTHAVQVHDN